ncbi:hypothetical protein H1235_12685 [Pseudoxanthomonas sp. NC8]|nr:hypothetical protein H1235_12685 [Pseudoxanthomonas sp. NC8]
MHRVLVDDGHGAELYLADAHPNGAGLVEWGERNWSTLLEGCVRGTGDASRMGRLIRDELARAGREPWRSPDILLRGFRNRQVHGLLDWRLGLDLLATLFDESFRPGLDDVLAGDASAPSAWELHARELVSQYAAAFPGCRPLQCERLSGWQEGVDMTVVVHPLWAGYAGPNNAVELATQWAARQGARSVRLVDSFNLSRRMVWVRGN